MSRVLKRHRVPTYDICEVCGGLDATQSLNVMSCWKCTRFFARFFNKDQLRDCVFKNRCLSQADQQCLYSCQECWMKKCKNLGMTIGNAVAQVKIRNYETTIILLNPEEKKKQEEERDRLRNLLDLSGVTCGEASPDAETFDYIKQEPEFSSFENSEEGSSALVLDKIKEEDTEEILDNFEMNDFNADKVKEEIPENSEEFEMNGPPTSFDYSHGPHGSPESLEDVKPSELLQAAQIMEEKPDKIEEITVPVLGLQYPKNPNIAILPTKKLVFNAPFNEGDVTKFRIFNNNSEVRIAFKIEIQSQGRLKSDQFFGVVDAGNSERIDVKCDFEGDSEDFGNLNLENDRIFVNLQNLADDEERNLEDVFLENGPGITKILNIVYNS